MPEGDTIHYAARRVGAALVGREIVSIEAPHPRHGRDFWPETLAGRPVEGVDAHGKHLFLRFAGGLTLHSHLRMTGFWGVYRRGRRWSRSPRRAWLVLRTAEHEVVQFDGVADRVLRMCAEVAAPESDVRVVREGSFGAVPGEVATGLAMVLTELVQNAVEHAFPDGRTGSITVRAARADTGLEVLVDDDGAGLPPDFDLQSSSRLGLQIARTLVHSDLRGTLELSSAPGEPGGTRALLRVPLTEPPASGSGA